MHALCNIFGRQFEAFLDENEARGANGGPRNGRIEIHEMKIFEYLIYLAWVSRGWKLWKHISFVMGFDVRFGVQNYHILEIIKGV